MTDHAIERLAERVKGIDAKAAFEEIIHTIVKGYSVEVCDDITGNQVREVVLSNYQTVFPVVSKDGAVITILTEGMEVITSTGKHELRPSRLSTGIHRISDIRYHADPCVNPSLSSTIGKKLIFQSPKHAWHASPRLNPDHEPMVKKAFDVGKAAHSMILGTGAPIADIPDDYLASNGAVSTKKAKEFVEQARADGKVPIKSDEARNVDLMKARLIMTLREADINLMATDSEVTAIADIDGVTCRAMIDNAPSDPTRPYLYDLKTTTDASLDAVMRSIMNYGYDFQAAHYLETWKAATGEDRSFRFIFQEKTAPFEVCLVELHEDSLIMGKKKTARAREIWRNCVSSNHWPGYPLHINQINLSPFFHEKWLERESREADFKNQTGHDILDFARRWQAPETLAGE